MRGLKKILALAVALLAMGSVALADGTIGISLPTAALDRWARGGAALVDSLSGLGYTVELHYAEDDVALQNEQILKYVGAGAKALIVCPVDGGALADSLARAKEAGIPVLSYDRLILNSDAVSHYVAFDSLAAGALQGEAIVSILDLDKAQEPFLFEVFSGSDGDGDAKMYYEGAWRHIEPFYARGILSIRSGQSSFQDTAIGGWSQSAAKERMIRMLTEDYPDGGYPNAILAANDALARGIIEALSEIGVPAENFPIITGQNCDAANLGYILDGRQAMSVFKDARLLASEAAQIADRLAAGAAVEANTSVRNGAEAPVPATLLAPIAVDAHNLRQVLIDSGYYAESVISK